MNLEKLSSQETYNESPYEGVVRVEGFENKLAFGSNIPGSELSLNLQKEKPTIENESLPPGEYPVDIIFVRTKENIYALRPKKDGEGWEYKSAATQHVGNLAYVTSINKEGPDQFEGITVGKTLRFDTGGPNFQEEYTDPVLEFVGINNSSQSVGDIERLTKRTREEMGTLTPQSYEGNEFNFDHRTTTIVNDFENILKN